MFLLLALVFYCLSSGLYLLNLLGRRRVKAEWPLMFGFLFHLASLLSSSLERQRFPLLELKETLSVLGCMLVGLHLFFSRRIRLEGFGCSISLLALAFTAAAYFVPIKLSGVPEILETFWFPLHTITCFLGMGAFALAFCAGVLYLLQERMIKSKKFGNTSRFLPSLDSLDRVNHCAMVVGFPLLSVGLLSGALWANYSLGGLPFGDPKVILSALTWMTYAILVHQRFLVGWRGRKAAVLAILGFFAVMFTFIGVNLFMGGHHSAISGLRG